MVNGDGETVLNYRKRFLYKTDETWALEGDGGFHSGDIPGLGKTVVGICMDLKSVDRVTLRDSLCGITNPDQSLSIRESVERFRIRVSCP